jgi:dTDP-4-amino-4,6-dideoxygalactose transaminase
VTQPYLLPPEDLIPMLEQIWASKTLTNGGPFHQKIEAALCEHLGVKHIALFANATIALVTALQAHRIIGEVITTPYSFVATSHALLWNGIKPVFVDVDPKTLNIDPERIEGAIAPQITAIMPAHCCGHPCDVERIQRIADTYNLKVIYVAAHAVGVECHCGGVLNHGDVSVLNFHATKVFNTFEGGAIVCPDAKTKLRIDLLKNFGCVDETTIVAPGINGKMSEFNAALGLLQRTHIDTALERRRQIDLRNRELLAGVDGILCLPPSGQTKQNYACFPVLVRPEFRLSRDALYQRTRDHEILLRRYFHPLSFWPTATRCTASSAAPACSTPSASTTTCSRSLGCRREDQATSEHEDDWKKTDLRHPAPPAAIGGVHPVAPRNLGQPRADQWRPVPRAAGGGAGRVPGSAAYRLVLQRHDRADHRAAGAARNRRGDHDAVLLRCHRPLAAVARQQAGLRRHRPGDAEHRPGEDRSRDHAADHRDHARALLRTPLRSGRDPAHRRHLQPAGDL